MFVFWHAGGVDDAQRAVYLIASRDGGDAFGAARRVGKADEGACGCCNMAALGRRGAGSTCRIAARARTCGAASAC